MLTQTMSYNSVCHHTQLSYYVTLLEMQGCSRLGTPQKAGQQHPGSLTVLSALWSLLNVLTLRCRGCDGW